MFNLSKGKLIKLKEDDSEEKVFQTLGPSLKVGSNLHYDCYISSEETIGFEISTDNFGRVKIKNVLKGPLLVNSEEILAERPLFTDSIIQINDEIRFKWEYQKCESNEKKGSEFAPWSDPGKKAKHEGIKPQIKLISGRLTAHALHRFSSMNSNDDSLHSSSQNVSISSFTDDQDDENKAIPTDDYNDTVLGRDDLLASPKTPLKMNNTSTPLIVLSDQKSFIKGDANQQTPIQNRLDFSHSTVTSYTPKTANKTTFGNKSITNTPKSRYLTPCSSLAFQTLDYNDTGKTLNASFGTVRAPSTPTSSNRSKISTYLIDLTTPDIFHTPSAGTSASVSIRSKTLLKSALKNSSQSTAGTTPRKSILGSTIKGHKLYNILNESAGDTTPSMHRTNVTSTAIASKLAPAKNVIASPAVTVLNVTPKMKTPYKTAGSAKTVRINTTPSNQYSSPYARQSVKIAKTPVPKGSIKKANVSLKGKTTTTALSSNNRATPGNQYVENAQSNSVAGTLESITKTNDDTIEVVLNRTFEIIADQSKLSVLDEMSEETNSQNEKHNLTTEEVENMLLEAKDDEETNNGNELSEEVLLRESDEFDCNQIANEASTLGYENPSGHISDPCDRADTNTEQPTPEVVEPLCVKKTIDYGHDCGVKQDSHPHTFTAEQFDGGNMSGVAKSIATGEMDSTAECANTVLCEDLTEPINIETSPNNISGVTPLLDIDDKLKIDQVKTIDQIDVSLNNVSQTFRNLVHEQALTMTNTSKQFDELFNDSNAENKGTGYSQACEAAESVLNHSDITMNETVVESRDMDESIDSTPVQVSTARRTIYEIQNMDESVLPIEPPSLTDDQSSESQSSKLSNRLSKTIYKPEIMDETLGEETQQSVDLINESSSTNLSVAEAFVNVPGHSELRKSSPDMESIVISALEQSSHDSALPADALSDDNQLNKNLVIEEASDLCETIPTVEDLNETVEAEIQQSVDTIDEISAISLNAEKSSTNVANQSNLPVLGDESTINTTKQQATELAIRTDKTAIESEDMDESLFDSTHEQTIRSRRTIHEIENMDESALPTEAEFADDQSSKSPSENKDNALWNTIRKEESINEATDVTSALHETDTLPTPDISSLSSPSLDQIIASDLDSIAQPLSNIEATVLEAPAVVEESEKNLSESPVNRTEMEEEFFDKFQATPNRKATRESISLFKNSEIPITTVDNNASGDRYIEEPVVDITESSNSTNVANHQIEVCREVVDLTESINSISDSIVFDETDFIENDVSGLNNTTLRLQETIIADTINNEAKFQIGANQSVADVMHPSVEQTTDTMEQSIIELPDDFYVESSNDNSLNQSVKEDAINAEVAVLNENVVTTDEVNLSESVDDNDDALSDGTDVLIYAGASDDSFLSADADVDADVVYLESEIQVESASNIEQSGVQISAQLMKINVPSESSRDLVFSDIEAAGTDSEIDPDIEAQLLKSPEDNDVEISPLNEKPAESTNYTEGIEKAIVTDIIEEVSTASDRTPIRTLPSRLLKTPQTLPRRNISKMKEALNAVGSPKSTHPKIVARFDTAKDDVENISIEKTTLAKEIADVTATEVSYSDNEVIVYEENEEINSNEIVIEAEESNLRDVSPNQLEEENEQNIDLSQQNTLGLNEFLIENILLASTVANTTEEITLPTMDTAEVVVHTSDEVEEIHENIAQNVEIPACEADAQTIPEYSCEIAESLEGFSQSNTVANLNDQSQKEFNEIIKNSLQDRSIKKVSTPVRAKLQLKSQTPLRVQSVGIVDSPRRSGRAVASINYAALLTPTKKQKDFGKIAEAKKEEPSVVMPDIQITPARSEVGQSTPIIVQNEETIADIIEISSESKSMDEQNERKMEKQSTVTLEHTDKTDDSCEYQVPGPQDHVEQVEIPVQIETSTKESSAIESRNTDILNTPKLSRQARLKYLVRSKTPLQARPITVVDSPRTSGRAIASINYATLLTPGRKTSNKVNVPEMIENTDDTNPIEVENVDNSPTKGIGKSTVSPFSPREQLKEAQIKITRIEETEYAALHVKPQGSLTANIEDEIKELEKVAEDIIVENVEISTEKLSANTNITTPRRVNRSISSHTPLQVQKISVIDSPRRSGRAISSKNYAALLTPSRKKNDSKKLHEIVTEDISKETSTSQIAEQMQEATEQEEISFKEQNLPESIQNEEITEIKNEIVTEGVSEETSTTQIVEQMQEATEQQEISFKEQNLPESIQNEEISEIKNEIVTEGVSEETSTSKIVEQMQEVTEQQEISFKEQNLPESIQNEEITEIKNKIVTEGVSEETSRSQIVEDIQKATEQQEITVQRQNMSESIKNEEIAEINNEIVQSEAGPIDAIVVETKVPEIVNEDNKTAKIEIVEDRTEIISSAETEADSNNEQNSSQISQHDNEEIKHDLREDIEQVVKVDKDVETVTDLPVDDTPQKSAQNIKLIVNEKSAQPSTSKRGRPRIPTRYFDDDYITPGKKTPASTRGQSTTKATKERATPVTSRKRDLQLVEKESATTASKKKTVFTKETEDESSVVVIQSTPKIVPTSGPSTKRGDKSAKNVVSESQTKRSKTVIETEKVGTPMDLYSNEETSPVEEHTSTKSRAGRKERKRQSLGKASVEHPETKRSKTIEEKAERDIDIQEQVASPLHMTNVVSEIAVITVDPNPESGLADATASNKTKRGAGRKPTATKDKLDTEDIKEPVGSHPSSESKDHQVQIEEVKPKRKAAAKQTATEDSVKPIRRRGKRVHSKESITSEIPETDIENNEDAKPRGRATKHPNEARSTDDSEKAEPTVDAETESRVNIDNGVTARERRAASKTQEPSTPRSHRGKKGPITKIHSEVDSHKSEPSVHGKNTTHKTPEPIQAALHKVADDQHSTVNVVVISSDDDLHQHSNNKTQTSRATRVRGQKINAPPTSDEINDAGSLPEPEQKRTKTRGRKAVPKVPANEATELTTVEDLQNTTTAKHGRSKSTSNELNVSKVSGKGKLDRTVADDGNIKDQIETRDKLVTKETRGRGRAVKADKAKSEISESEASIDTQSVPPKSQTRRRAARLASTATEAPESQASTDTEIVPPKTQTKRRAARIASAASDAPESQVSTDTETAQPKTQTRRRAARIASMTSDAPESQASTDTETAPPKTQTRRRAARIASSASDAPESQASIVAETAPPKSQTRKRAARTASTTSEAPESKASIDDETAPSKTQTRTRAARNINTSTDTVKSVKRQKTDVEAIQMPPPEQPDKGRKRRAIKPTSEEETKEESDVAMPPPSPSGKGKRGRKATPTTEKTSDVEPKSKKLRKSQEPSESSTGNSKKAKDAQQAAETSPATPIARRTRRGKT